ncbi:Glutamine amidotransferase type 1 [uncultured Sporomusa sp.]|uniref:Glutamine amidotransferase type 1 n=1 Tax=uncultured Sporomusa sp. TaxID=307249 RepID=A0A212LLX7_9FIRM|nr:gamma-glutamyl-gamma-aminobutyrate hydrolase family protein [uncultured Sporomusa sp.]SCM78544.1 Glutamine amidotransferase type 1 [uncultured Sporomusa sp.]
MRKPLIGITANQFVTEGGIMAGTKRQFVSDAYVRSILSAGGVPVLLPIITGQSAIEQQLAAMDGLLLTGGGDLQPQLFGEEPVPALGKVIPERDTHELLLVALALKADKPVLGICRGCQVLAIASGGTIYQHLSADEAAIQHDQNSPADYAGHTVLLEPGCKLATILGDKVMTNSFHHQAVKSAGRGLTVSARAKDGIIEAIEHETAAFAVGVQWHPELMIDSNPAMLALFEAFVSAAGRRY